MEYELQRRVFRRAPLTSGFVGFAGAPPGPDSISGLRVWLKADSESYANDDPVDTATDRSGNGFNGTATGTDRPIFKTNQINSLPAYFFEAANSRKLTFGNFGSGMTAAHTFIVLKVVTDPPATQAKSGLWYLSTGAATHYPYTDNSIYDGAFTDNRATVGDPTPALTSWRVYEVSYVGTSQNWTAFLDRTQIYQAAFANFSMPAAPLLGRNVNATDFLDGYIAEWIIYNKVLSAGEISTIKSYLESKYALSLA